MRIAVGKLKNIKLATHQLAISQEIDPKAYGYAELELIEPLSFVGKIENVGELLHLQGVVSGSLQLVCSRCLANYTWDFASEINEDYTNKPELADQDQDELLNLYSGDEIDIAPQLLDQIFIDMPMKLVCKADCQGLCPQCGADLNQGSCGCGQEVVDIRLEKLKDFFEK